MVTAPHLSPKVEKKKKLDLIPSLVTRAHLDHPLDFIWDLQFVWLWD